MVALTLWIALAAELMIYASFARWLGLGAAATATLCTVLLIGARVMFIALTFVLSRVYTSSRQLVAECSAFIAAWVLMLLEPLLRPRRRAPVSDHATLLVHGWNCNSGIWWPLLRRLRRSGDAPTTVTVNLSPWAGLEQHIARLREAIGNVARTTRSGTVAVVGHSMGGVVALAAVAEPETAAKVVRLVALGSPFGGTELARYALDRAGRALRTGRKQALSSHMRVTAVYSDTDNFVVPATSARVEGAENLLFPGLGHMELAFARPVLDAVVERLESMDGTR